MLGIERGLRFYFTQRRRDAENMYKLRLSLFNFWYNLFMVINEISGQIVDSAIEVHRELGPGLLEAVYEAALAIELESRGFKVARQVPCSVYYKSIELEMGYRLDLLIENCVIVELKSIEKLEPIHHKQLQTYLKLSDKRLGLLINFNVPLLKDGLKRIVNNL